MFVNRLVWLHLKRRSCAYSQSTALKNDVLDKIVYNSVLQDSKSSQYWRKVGEKKKILKRIEFKHDIEPVSLQYLDGYIEQKDSAPKPIVVKGSEDRPHVLPYSIVSKVNSINNDEKQIEENEDNEIYYDYELNELMNKNWMSDYECYEERNLEEENNIPSWTSKYGTPDPSINISHVPCGGCGALLQCQNVSIPGYLPSELFCHCSPEDLRTMVCQRCHFMLKYKTALSVQVDPIDYPKLLYPLKKKRVLIILMVDLTDFPCSIWPNITECIGTNKPVVIVGNKLDLLPGDFPGWINHVQKTLVQSIPKEINIKHVAVVSAKTGFGIEELINKLHTLWQTRGDVYLIGCTNVGKSTMFNTLLQSDYCKVKAVDLVQRATTSPWPGTTLNLLKFPIMRPSNWRLYMRTQRLMSESKERVLEQQMEADQRRSLRMKIDDLPSIIGRIGYTFYNPLSNDTVLKKNENDSFASNIVKPKENRVTSSSLGLDENDPQFKFSKWVFDTPGVVHPDQSINLLTTEELMMTLPTTVMEPRTFNLRTMQTLFVGGLGRIDCLKTSEKFVRFTVFSASTLPITVCDFNDADEIYKKLLGTHLFAVPCGGKKRLEKWPGLSCYKKPIQLTGIDHKTSCADIVLSSAGWVAVTPFKNDVCDVQAWTPECRGIYVRTTPLLRYAVNNRGPRLKFTPTFYTKKE
ncbi:nitric oxide-associated protein 1 [Sipha flava]|uniref:Nitric oxide-associated protein 1 n=1 Tax=Sipha flava TaxID=143950 RepID=A0A2S2Q454_9HEMI|nr:nitric oxide-associated protein 1 [Sipha flava]